MRKVIIIAGVVVIGAAVFFFFRSGGDRSRDYVLRRLNTNGVVVRRSCGSGEAYVDAARWRALRAADQERAASALASWCAEQGGMSTLTVLDDQTRATLARWNGTSIEPGR